MKSKTFNQHIGLKSNEIDSLLSDIKDTQGISFFSSSEENQKTDEYISYKDNLNEIRSRKNNQPTNELF